MIREGMVIVDLGAAPGGWTQASAQALASKSGKATVGRYKSHGLIVALDLLPLSKALKDMPDVHFIQGDFLSSPVRTKLVQLLRTVSPASQGKVDLVLSDMLANMSGNPLRDAQSSIDLCDAALEFALEHLRVLSVSKGVGEEMKKVAPSLVMKCLQSSLSQAFRDRLRSHFRTVKWEKPSSSRPESREGYWVCSGLKVEVVSGEGAENKESGEGAKEEDDIYF
jgi:23S rRNA (uridine2552-2'-O)-methyltransferase